MSSNIDNVCVIGLGYVGLPTAAIIANRGVDVFGVDIDEDIVEKINAGLIHITEPDLDILVQAAVSSGRLTASSSVRHASVFIIAVPTPLHKDKKPNLSYVESAAKSIAPFLQEDDLVILESTSPVGTIAKLVGWLKNLRPDLEFPDQANDHSNISVAYCPERVLPGRVLVELVTNDRIIGGVTPQCANRAADFYKLFSQGDCLITTPQTAELAKLTENAFRDVNIALANELSLICEELSVDVWELIKLCNRHPRVNILSPGPGVGGHCIAIDPWFIINSTPKLTRIIKNSRIVNDTKPNFFIEKIVDSAKRFKQPIIACLGLSYKPDIDDLRESPSLSIVRELSDLNVGKILISEPHIDKLPEALAAKRNIELAETENAISRADIVVPLVSHKAFKEIERSIFDQKVIIDACGLLSLDTA